MKNLVIPLLAIIISCNGTSENHSGETKDTVTVVHDTVTIVKDSIVIEKESEILQNDNVKKAFLAMVDALNNASSENALSVVSYLDEDYVFKGKTKEQNKERFQKQFERFQFQFTDVNIERVESSCDLAYLIVSFKKTIIGRESGNIAVDGRDKVGLFMMRKNSAGHWKLLVQKTDDGFAHWFYMPEEK